MGHVARIGKKRNAHKLFIDAKMEQRGPLEDLVVMGKMRWV